MADDLRSVLEAVAAGALAPEAAAEALGAARAAPGAAPANSPHRPHGEPLRISSNNGGRFVLEGDDSLVDASSPVKVAALSPDASLDVSGWAPERLGTMWRTAQSHESSETKVLVAPDRPLSVDVNG